MKKYVEYTNRRVNQMKQGLRAGTPRLELAKTLCKEWDVPRNAVYQKIHKVAAELKAFKNKWLVNLKVTISMNDKQIR